ncbi:hypothetical protein Trydic_g1014 [Trypoxylus dichotomus]
MHLGGPSALILDLLENTINPLITDVLENQLDRDGTGYLMRIDYIFNKMELLFTMFFQYGSDKKASIPEMALASTSVPVVSPDFSGFCCGEMLPPVCSIPDISNFDNRVSFSVQIDKSVFLVVTLDRFLSYKHHCEKIRQKVVARKNIARKFTKSKWSSKLEVLRTTALALCFSTGVCPVWSRSALAGRIFTERQALAAPVHTERPTNSMRVSKTSTNNRHPLFDLQHRPRGLKSRRRFLDGYRRDKVNLTRWGLAQLKDDMCDCGVIQITEHLLECVSSPNHCTIDDLCRSSPEVLDVARCWAERL